MLGEMVDDSPDAPQPAGPPPVHVSPDRAGRLSCSPRPACSCSFWSSSASWRSAGGSHSGSRSRPCSQAWLPLSPISRASHEPAARAIIGDVALQSRCAHAGAAAIVARISRCRGGRGRWPPRWSRRSLRSSAFPNSSHVEIVAGLQRSLRRWSRFLVTGVMPPDDSFDPLREWARARAAEGVAPGGPPALVRPRPSARLAADTPPRSRR